MRNLLNVQFMRFVLVGALNTAFSYAVYAALLYGGMPFAMANLTALALGIVFSYCTQSTLVFRIRQNSRIWRFAACWACIYLFNIALIAVFMRWGLNAYVGGALALVPVTLASYVIQRFLVFGNFKIASAS